MLSLHLQLIVLTMFSLAFLPAHPVIPSNGMTSMGLYSQRGISIETSPEQMETSPLSQDSASSTNCPQHFH
jgi:hypothetical protein